jgi:hypothetical protein
MVFPLLEHCGQTGGPRASSGSRPLVTRSVKLFVNLLLVTTVSYIFFTPNELKSVISISPSALRTSATHATTDLKTLP